MTAKNDLRLVILSLGLGLVLTGMGVRAIACQNSSNLPPQPPLTKGGLSSDSPPLSKQGLSSDSLNKAGLSSDSLNKAGLSSDPLNKAGLSSDSPPLSKQGLSSDSLNKAGLSSDSLNKAGLSSDSLNKGNLSSDSLNKGGLSSDPLNNDGLSSNSPPLTKGGTQGGSIPQPQANGDYRRSPHSSWETTQSNTQGIDCRMLRNTNYSQLENPSNKTELNIENWPVVGKLPAGQDFEINLGPAGFGVVYDTKQQPWIYVEKTDQTAAPSHCFVRANRQFVQPISAN